MWWNPDYIYRRSVEIVAPQGGVPAGHPVVVEIPDLISQGKANSNFSDLEVVGGGELLPRRASTTNRTVEFQLNEDLESEEVSRGRYYIYYGNRADITSPSAPTFDYWPMKVPFNGLGVSYTRPEEHWKDGVSTTVGARATFTFYGEHVRLVAVGGPDRGIIEYQIDELEWEEVNLFTLIEQEAVVLSVVDLGPGMHTLRVKVSSNRDASARGNKVEIVRFEYSKYVVANDLGEEIYDLSWSSSVGGV